MRWLLAACYPLLSHFALMRRQPDLEWIALMVLFAACFYSGLKQGRRYDWLAFAAFAALVGGLMLIDTQAYALYLPPMVFPVLALLSFAGSLLPGREPLVTQIATAAHGGTLAAEFVPYTRAVTWGWTLILVGILGIDVALLCFGSRELWSLWANFIGYLVVAAVFVLEYVYRRIRFRKLQQQSLVEYLRTLTQVRPHVG
ncbi:MAG: hypothetical protein JWR16_1591 [Nevskia sp.]|nr:hypothetical protein [Nevskia sp.]